jgi:hypothetical protein
MDDVTVDQRETMTCWSNPARTEVIRRVQTCLKIGMSYGNQQAPNTLRLAPKIPCPSYGLVV